MVLGSLLLFGRFVGAPSQGSPLLLLQVLPGASTIYFFLFMRQAKLLACLNLLVGPIPSNLSPLANICRYARKTHLMYLQVLIQVRLCHMPPLMRVCLETQPQCPSETGEPLKPRKK